MDMDQKIDALGWLEDEALADVEPHARAVLDLLDWRDSTENTVLGMLMARRPHDEIRDYILARSL